MQKQKPVYSHSWRLEKSIPGVQKVIDHWLRNRKKKPVGSIKMRTKIKLSPKTLYLLIPVNLRPKSPRKTSIMEVAKETNELLGSMSLR